jgi:ABC-type ATPase involved in cell division
LGLELVTTPTLAMTGEGNKDCWKEGRFRIEDVKNGYDVRRSKTDEIINSIGNHVGTILFGESYSGKSTILDRVILEEVAENGYAVVHGEVVKAKASLLR